MSVFLGMPVFLGMLGMLVMAPGCAAGKHGPIGLSETPTAAPAPSATPRVSTARSAAEVIAEVVARGQRIERVDAALTMDLKRADGAAARLSATLRMARSDHFRVRSTKWGFLVCDVIVRGDDASALLSPVVRDQALSSAEATVALARVLGALVGWLDGAAGETTHFDLVEVFEVIEERDDAIVVRIGRIGRAANADIAASTPHTGRAASTTSAPAISLEWTLARSDGRPLRVRRMEGEVVTGVLTCSDHIDIDGVPMPTHLRFESTTGTIDVKVRQPRVNPPADDRAFDLPDGAEPLMVRTAEADRSRRD